MKEGIVKTNIIIEKPVSECLVIKIPTNSLPVSLKTGTSIVEEIKKFCEKVKRQRLTDKLERFLKRAYEAEEKKNYFRAGRAFALALLCEGKLKEDVEGNAFAYVYSAMPVY